MIFITISCSLDVRQKVLSIKEQEGLTGAETAVHFEAASITRWNKQVEPKRTRSKPATKLDIEALKKDVDYYPDAYQLLAGTRLTVTLFIGTINADVFFAFRKMCYPNYHQTASSHRIPTPYSLDLNPIEHQ